MLRRSLASALQQTYKNIAVRVINDDPEDIAVDSIVKMANDSRVKIYRPTEKRGGTRNFNLIFSEKEASFVSLLEDDNWWEPAFVESMYNVLKNNPDIPCVVGNEMIWRELPGAQWVCTGRTIWDFFDVRRHQYTLGSICGSAKICNSSMLFRLPEAANFITPDSIPIDVTEHFRERLLPPAILLNGTPLVNYAETLQTARGSGHLWGLFQIILIGSPFQAVHDGKKRRLLAQALWSECKSPTSPRAVNLVLTGLAMREARSLFEHAPLRAIARTAAWFARHPHSWRNISKVNTELKEELAFLVEAPLTKYLAAHF
jgi:Glycosyl transferase family 2